jgi:hypothetical protein
MHSSQGVLARYFDTVSFFSAWGSSQMLDVSAMQILWGENDGSFRTV